MTPAPLIWTWGRLDGLSPRDVYDFLALRGNAFVVEQNCAFLDPDGLDDRSWHLLGRAGVGTLVAYLRVLDPGVKFTEPSIGRVVTKLSHRRMGVGALVTQQGISRTRALWPALPIRISAQHRLESFYAAFGFVTVGEAYLEDNISHIDMLLAAVGMSPVNERQVAHEGL